MNNTDEARGCQCRSISDFYFYGELVQRIGPEASNEWLRTCALQRTRACSSASASTKPPPGSSTCQKSHGPTSTTHRFTSDYSAFKSEYTQNLDRVTSSHNPGSIPQLARRHKPSDGQDETTCRMALDIEISAASTSNFGLLFTDAAHIVLHGSRKLARVKRGSSAIV